MRSKSPELMSEIKKYIEDYYLQNRQSPSTTKIAEAVGIARGTAYKYLVEMAEKNMIEYDGQEISVAAGLFCRKMDGRFCRKKPDTDVRRAGRIDVAGVFCRTREGRGQSRSLH